MKIKLLAATLLVIVSLLVSSVTPAFAVPPKPASFYGTVKINGNNVPVGTPISAWINGVQNKVYYSTMYLGNSVYALKVEGDDPDTPAIDGGRTGDTIIFRIGISNASETGVWREGSNLELNLTLAPNAIALASFTGKPQFSTVQLDWETATEVGLVGFNVYRSEAPNGSGEQLNSSLILANNPDQMEGSSYQFADLVKPGRHYYYWLELVFVSSTSQSFPIDLTTQFLMYMPLLK